MNLLKSVISSNQGKVGAALLVFALGVAFLGPVLAGGAVDVPVGVPGGAPSETNPLGLDALGRDVLTRVAHGGLSVVSLATMATVLAYLLALPLGLISGYASGAVDNVLMRGVDLLLAFPALVIPLILAGALGPSPVVLVAGAALVQLPTIARVTRAATLEVRGREYVDAAVGRGESRRSIIRREIIPNIAPTVLAGMGLVFGWCVIVIASMNYLGLGLQPPAADWGLMIAENQQYVQTNPYAVLAPALMLAMLTVGISFMADAYSRSLGVGPSVPFGKIKRRATPDRTGAIAVVGPDRPRS